MTAPSRRAIANSVATRLVSVAKATGYYGQIGRPLPGQALVSDGGTVPDDPQPKDPLNGDMRVKPYFILYPGAGSPSDELAVADTITDLVMPLPITAAAGDIEDLLALCDRILGVFDTWRPAIDGVAFDRVRFPLGYVPGQYLTDDQFKPARLYIRLPLQLTATT
ncbi:MAG TPA: hypothetical protein VGE38_07155 [Nocardioides sp.]|uniref:hypothetical protein n=1 Tax=Nocardioides sp. TaxID=35761 RepID=UPI002ED8528C